MSSPQTPDVPPDEPVIEVMDPPRDEGPGGPSSRSLEERRRRERYEVFDRLIDSTRGGALTPEAAIAIFRDLSPVAVQQVIPGTPHRHELDAVTGETWCMDCGSPVERCPTIEPDPSGGSQPTGER